jgi:nitrite reductase/ring-hydroxylating ferredoxin subunit
MDGARIAALDELSTDDTHLFRVRSVGDDDRPGDDADEREAICIRLADEDRPTDDVACWLNVCQHMTHIPLDKGSGAPVRGGEILCANHGAMFEADTGRCTYGPCEGAVLTEVGVRVAGGDVYLADENYEYVGPGPVDTDDDRSSDSNVIL